MTKKDLKDSAGREARHGELTPRLTGYAGIFEEQLDMFARQLEGVAERVRSHELTPYLISIPGIGIGIAAVILAYIGDGSRGRWPITRVLRRGWIVPVRRSGTAR